MTHKHATLNFSKVGDTPTSTTAAIQELIYIYISTNAWHLKLDEDLKREIPNKSHETMVIMQPSIDINYFPCSFASLITYFIKYCLNLTYEQHLEFGIQGIQVRE